MLWIQKKFFGFAPIFILLYSGLASASFEFGPIVANLTPSGPGASMAYQATNSSNGKVAVQISIVAREPDLKGEEVYKESDLVDEQFKIFPAQLILAAGEVRTVRITYVGPQKLKSEASFRVLAEELPVDLEDPNKKQTKAVARINITTKYVGSLYVTPIGAEPKIEIDAKPSTGSKTTKLLLTIKNTGLAHQLIKNPTLKIQPPNGAALIQLSGSDIKELSGQNILAGKTRTIEVAWPKGVAVGAMKVSLDLPKN